MRIGELSARTGCRADVIRYYERLRLLPAARRRVNNYRDYGPAHLERLAFIRRCRSLDMSLPEIRTLLDAVQRPESDCAPVNALLDKHIEHVATRIDELEQLKTELDAIRAHCSGARPGKQCGILETLARPARKQVRAHNHIASAHQGRSPRR